jgi:anaerobic selenocysteine-containing dehydrogenase
MASGKLGESQALAGSIKLEYGGKDFSPDTGVERKAVPTACWSCVTRCAAMGFVEDGRLVKMESHPNSIRTEGLMCSKGQSGPNDVYFPDRILYPMKRVGERGDGKWKRISWDEALDEMVSVLKPLRDAGTPEKFCFHYGRMKASSSKLIKSLFLNGAYGTKTVPGHTSICEGGKWTAHELVWGGHFDNWDFDNTDYVLNFGSNVLETHTNHIPCGPRLIRAKVDRGVKVVTFDVRLSNTAAKSDEWVPVKPGTDIAVLLAMCNVVLNKGLYKGKGEKFMKFVKATKNHDASVADKIATLKKHCADYTPAWASKISGVPASKIETLAVEFATAKSACLVTYRGVAAHHNGNEGERAAFMLASLTGNVDNPGGRTKAVGAGVKYPKIPKSSKYPKPKGLNIGKGSSTKGHPLYSSFPSHGVCQAVLKMIEEKQGVPDVYMTYCYNPVYVNGNFAENKKILRSIKHLWSSNIVYDESSKHCDLIIPDATYLERWDWEDMVDPNNIGEQYIRQACVKPLGESRDMGDVACQLAEKMGIPLGVSSKEEFVKKSYDMTPGVKEAGGAAMMMREGVWHDPNQKPIFMRYKNKISADKVNADGVVYDEATGVYWNAKKAHAKDGGTYENTKNSYKYYVGQKIGDEVYEVFKPDKLPKSGYLELYSQQMERKGHAPLPTYYADPAHENLGPNDLILTTYKVAVHIHSRSTHRKWLTELYHDNPGWINPKTAAARGIKDGDKITVKSNISTITTTAKVTEKIGPGIIAISYHLGREESGRYGSGKKSPGGHDNDPDLALKWWDTYGVHPNHVIPNTVDPVNGQQCWMDTVVQVAKA